MFRASNYILNCWYLNTYIKVFLLGEVSVLLYLWLAIHLVTGIGFHIGERVVCSCLPFSANIMWTGCLKSVSEDTVCCIDPLENICNFIVVTGLMFCKIGIYWFIYTTSFSFHRIVTIQKIQNRTLQIWQLLWVTHFFPSFGNAC